MRKCRARKVRASADQGQAQGLKLGMSWSFVSCECILHFCPCAQGRRKCGPRAKKLDKAHVSVIHKWDVTASKYVRLPGDRPADLPIPTDLYFPTATIAYRPTDSPTHPPTYLPAQPPPTGLPTFRPSYLTLPYRTYTHNHTCIRIHIKTYICAQTYTDTQTHTHRLTHTQTHIYIHTYTHIQLTHRVFAMWPVLESTIW